MRASDVDSYIIIGNREEIYQYDTNGANDKGWGQIYIPDNDYFNSGNQDEEGHMPNVKDNLGTMGLVPNKIMDVDSIPIYHDEYMKTVLIGLHGTINLENNQNIILGDEYKTTASEKVSREVNNILKQCCEE